MNSVLRVLLEAALYYASIGWHVFPCRGKKPLTPNGLKDATTNAEQITQWWERWPDANIGVRTGKPSGLVVVDCDGQEGIADFESVVKINSPLPFTTQSKTGGDGSHIFFRHPGDVRIGNRAKIDGKNIDLRADGGYVILPPSNHVSGKKYEFENPPSEVMPAELPAWLGEFITKKKGSKTPDTWGVGFNLETAPGVSEGSRHDSACQIIGAHLGRGEPWGTVLKKALAWNQRNRPPLPDDEIRKIVHDIDEKERSKGGKQNASAKQRTLLLDIANECRLFRAVDGETFATIEVRGHDEFWPIKSKRFRRWLIRHYRRRFGDSPRSESLNNAIETLDAEAAFDGEQVAVFVRAGTVRESIYLDLCDDEWQVVEIGVDGWRVISDPPVKFRRGSAMLPLPIPQRGGSLQSLQSILNIKPDDWPLVLGWLVGSLQPDGPFPILAIYGEQGGSKSTTTRLLRSLVDPSKAPLRTEPRNEQDLMIAAKHSWVLAFDNLSKIPAWLSDALCRLSTGGAFGARQLFTDSDEVLIDASRPVILTSIGEVATRSDLLDRCIVVQLMPIPADRRRTEADLFSEFDSEVPMIFGALLDAVVMGLRNLPTTNLARIPRMADFARWVTACEAGLGIQSGQFLDAYATNRAAARDMALESSPIFKVLRSLLEATDTFEGTATELLDALNSRADESTRSKPNWPGSPRYLADRMRELAPSLRDIGYRVEEQQTTGSGSRKLWILESPGHGTQHALVGAGRT